MAKNVVKPFTFPKAKGPIAPKATPMPTEDVLLRKFATKPVVKPPGTKGMTKKLKSYLP